MGTKNNPGQYDCHSKAEPDEPTFTLLGRDPVAGFLVGVWIDARKKLGLDTPEKLAEASAVSDALHDYAMEKLGPDRMLEVVTAMNEILVGYARDTKQLDVVEDVPADVAMVTDIAENIAHVTEPAAT